VIFIDSNIPMYLVGAPHPHKAEAQILVERAAASSERLVTDAEVMQEILHRYTAIHRRDAVGPALQVLLDLVDEVFPVRRPDVLRAAEIAQHPAALSSRDSIHVAIMEQRSIDTVMSFDADFDRWPGLHRIHTI
jgi:predicted nucleic acid-binding protein